MGLNVDKTIQQEGITLPQSTQPTEAEGKAAAQPIDFSKAGSNQEVTKASASQPIDMTSKTQAQKPAESEREIYEVKKGDNLWNVAKQMLKVAGNPKPSNAEIYNAMLDIAKANGCKTIEDCRDKYFNKIGSQLDVTGLFGKSESKPAQVIESAKTDDAKQVSTVPKSELEELAEKSGIKGDNIDSIIGELKGMPADELTPVQAELLKKYDEVNKPQNSSFYDKLSDEDKMSIDIMKQIRTEQFMKKSYEEKMDILTQMIVKHDAKYNALETEEEKKSYMAQIRRELIEITGDKDSKLLNPNSRIVENNFEFSLDNEAVAVRLVIAMKREHLTFDELKNMSASDRDNLVVKYEKRNNNLKFAYDIELLQDPKFKNTTDEEKVSKLIENRLERDPKYRDLSPKQQKVKKDEEFIKYAFKLGIIKERDKNIYIDFINNGGDISSIKAGLSANILLDMKIAVQYAEEHPEANNKNIVDILGDMSSSEKLSSQKSLLEKMEKSGEIMSPAQKELLGEIRTICDLYKELNLDQGKEPTPEQIINIASKKINSGNLTDKQKAIYQDMLDEASNLKEINEARLKDGKKLISYKYSLNMEALNVLRGKSATLSHDVAAGFVSSLKGEYDSPENILLMKTYVQDSKYIGNFKALKEEYMKRFGITEEQFNELITKNDIIPEEMFERYMARTKTGAEVVDVVAGAKHLGSESANALASVAYKPIFGLNEEQGAAIYGIAPNDKGYTDAASTGMRQYTSKDFQHNVMTIIDSSTTLSKSAKANIAESYFETAATDQERLDDGKALSSRVSDSAFLEGMAAASDSFTDANLRNQYNSHITTAASNLPPEDQARITTAMQTGQISKETLSKTSTSNSNSSQSSQSSQTTQSTQSQAPKAQASSAQAASQTTQAQAPKATTTTQTQAPKVNVTISQNIQRMYQEATNSYTQKVYEQINVLEKEAEENKAKVEKEAREAEAKREKERLEKSVQSSENMRQEAMAKAKEVQESIQASVEEWEARHKKLTTEDGATVSASIVIGLAEDMISDSNLPAEEKENLKQQVFKASSIEEIYDILASRAIEISSVIEKVMSLLESSSSSTATKAVAELVKTSEGRKLLYKIAPAEEYVLSEVLSEDEVFSLLDSNEIKHIGYVNESTLIRYIKKNIYLMPNWKFSRYLKYLSLDDREALVEKRNKEKGIITQTTVPTGENHEADMVTVARVEEENQENKIFKNNERTTTLADGTMITKEGSGFGAVSDNDYETSRIIQPKKKEDGAPIGMNDDVLTVGSAEWNLKYNKGNVQSTAFTMAAMEEDDEDDGVGNFMSTKGNFKGRKIKKKYRSSGFNAMG